jgi:hypothetical protein
MVITLYSLNSKKESELSVTMSGDIDSCLSEILKKEPNWKVIVKGNQFVWLGRGENERALISKF